MFRINESSTASGTRRQLVLLAPVGARVPEKFRNRRENARSHSDLLADAQRLGYAEADPFMDVSGTDAAHKIAILAGMLLPALSKAKDSPEAADTRETKELEEKLNWDTRIFEERSHSLAYVCETPVLLEQRVFEIGRQIQERL